MIHPLTTSLFPSVAQQTGAGSVLDSRRALRTLVMPFAAGLVCAAAISFSARTAVAVFLDSSYSGSVNALRILAWFLPMVFVSSTSLRMLMACGRTGTAVRILAVNCAANIAANLLLVPAIGIEGAALSALLSGALSAVQSVAALRGTT
jgi:O-antigen/teichoic acid export membrane protein